MRVRSISAALLVALSLYGASETVSAQNASNPESLLALARSERAAGHRIEALAYCQELLAQWPDNREALRLNIELLSELGAAARANELAASSLPAGDEAERTRLLTNYAAHQTRWAYGEPDDPHQPYVLADQAVANIQKVANDPDAPANIRQRARLDLLVALQQGDRSAEVLAEYDKLKQQHVQLPAYAERAVAAAMMQQHHPRKAIPLYEDSIHRDPGPYDLNDTDPRIGLAYAYLETGHARKALKIVDVLASSEPQWLRLPGVRGGTENQRKVDADTSAAAMRQYADMLAEAHARFAAMSHEAPGNAQLLRDLAMSELARGWPRRALETLNMADTLDRRDVSGMLNKAEVNRSLYCYAEAQAQLAQAKQLAPRNSQVRDALDAWNRERGWQFDLTHDNGHGNSPDYGDRDEETQATLASPLIDDHWRVLALVRTASASLPEGDAWRDRAGLGVQGYLPGLEFYVQALPAFDHFVRRAAFETGFTWALSDQWSWSTDWSTAGAEIPLRAQYYGITGKTLDTAIQWRASEQTSARLALYQYRFTDGNLRNGWLADVVQRLHTGPNFSFDGGVEVGGQTNSETDRPYFNPAQDRTYAFTGSLKNLLSQDYDRTWNQRFDFAIGQYAERNYATGWMANVHYGQTFQPHAGLRFGWGLGWYWQPYDGRHESRVVLDVTMHWGE